MTPSGTRPAPRAVHLKVTGRVQGVGFRWFVLQEAQTAGVSGWVKNLDDGGVEAWIEGDADAVRRVEEAVTRGPRHARVLGVERREERPTGRFREFGVER